MKTSLPIISLCLLFLACESDPCKELKNGVYQYPELPENHTMTSDEVDKFYYIPSDIAECISTEGLIESILTYPHVGLIFAHHTGDGGYKLLKNHFNGPDVLETRLDRSQELLKKYMSWDPLGIDPSWENLEIGRYMARGVYLEVFINQFKNLENLDRDDQKTLFGRSLEVYDNEKSLLDYYGYFALRHNTATVARLMYLHKYEPFMSLYKANEYVFNLTAYISAAPQQIIDQIHEMAVEYFKTL
ncbi:MAG: hypothetical protein K0B37_17470 [Bacteroidales bacterium]|nr:hypothetical protein [Bacteroidales bacterium]